MYYHDIFVSKPAQMSEEEAAELITQEFTDVLDNLCQIDILYDGENDEYVIMRGTKKSHITRIRRITGYCSNVNNFNSAKQAELADRKTHI